MGLICEREKKNDPMSTKRLQHNRSTNRRFRVVVVAALSTLMCRPRLKQLLEKHDAFVDQLNLETR